MIKKERERKDVNYYFKLAFRMWCNSIGIEDLFINNLYADF